MSRAAVLSLLRGDATLATLGGTGFVVEAQLSYDQRPNDAGAFIVIVWRHTDFEDDIQANAERHFDLYVHIPMLVSTDFGRIDAILDRCDALFAAVADGDPVAGGDGLQLDYVGFEGRGMDMTDEGYETICRQASYMALSCTVPA
jgi:hypothetical protein